MLVLHAHKHDRLANVVFSGLMKSNRRFDVWMDDETYDKIDDDTKIILVTSANPKILNKYLSLTVPNGVFKVLVNTFDAYVDDPPYEEFDLIFLREYREEFKDNPKIIPLSMGLTEERIDRIREHMKPWQYRDVDIFYRSQVRLPGRKEIVSTFNSMKVLQGYDLDGMVIDVKHSAMEEVDFYKALGNSRVGLSPAGGGWDCFRHYEILAAGGYPIMPKHWYWNPSGYTSTGEALEMTREVLTDKPNWSEIGIDLEDDVNKAAFIMKEINRVLTKRRLDELLKEMKSLQSF